MFIFSVLWQYCRQPGILLHHSHRGTVQQSKWKHQDGHQGQSGCMTEALDFIIFMPMNRKTLEYDFYLRSDLAGRVRNWWEWCLGNFLTVLVGSGATLSSWLPYCCHGYETLQSDCGWIFRWCFLFKHLYFDTVLVSIEKKGTWNQWYLSYVCW